MSSKKWDKSAENYYDDVISPIKNSINNPLDQDLKKLKGKIVDIGCGIGELVENLSKQFDEVHAWDYSENMIEKAKEKNSKVENVFFEVKDTTKLKEKEKFDVALSINSLLEPNIVKLNKMIKNIYRTIKTSGTFICIVPSLESYIYQEIIANEKKLLGKNIPKEDEFSKNKINFIDGTITFEGEKQKAFYRFEMLYRLEKNGFKNIEISKIKYHWKDWFDAGQRYFPTEKEPWDWYVKCKK